MLQTLGFIVHLVPRHAEDFVQHAFDEVMADASRRAILRPEAVSCTASVLTDRHQAIALQIGAVPW